MSQQADLRAEKRREEKEKPPAKPGRKRKETATEGSEAVPTASVKRSKGKDKELDAAEPAGGNEPDALPETVEKPAKRTRKGKGKHEEGDEKKKDQEVAEKPKGKGKGKGKSGDPDTRKLKADQAYEKLIGAGMSDMKIPKLGDRKSFTLTAPGPDKSSVGVVLYSESFYVSRCVPPESSWPSSCSSLKVPISFVFLFAHLASLLACTCMCWLDLHMSSCVALIPLDRWIQKVVLLFLGILLMVKR